MARLKQALIQIDRTDTDPTTKVGSADLLTGEARHSLLFDELTDTDILIRLHLIYNAKTLNTSVLNKLFGDILKALEARLSDE